ncbi:unnamed protein product [Boreogadus saida]
MARSTNRGNTDGDPRVSVSTGSGEARDLTDLRELSLEEVLKSYEQPINEEQAWAVCYQCCGGARAPHPATGPLYQVKDPSSILLHRDGTVSLQQQSCSSDDTDRPSPPVIAERQLVRSMGVAIYQALDWGLDDSEEQELSPQLESLLERMACGDGEADSLAVGGGGGADRDGCVNGTADEGYSGQEDEEQEEEEDEEEEEEGVDEGVLRSRRRRPVYTLAKVKALCASRLANPAQAVEHYPAVCRALFVETLELQTFLTKIQDAKEMLKEIRKDEIPEDSSTAELGALKHTDWARLWVQLMKDLRQGVKLKKVGEQPFNPLPTEFSLTPFEMLMQDIRSRKIQLRKVMVDGDIPTRVKRNAHEMILDFIRSRPPLKPVSERSLPPPPQEPESLHQRLLAGIKQERKLRPVASPPSRSFGSMPCLALPCPCNVKSTSCIDLSASDGGLRAPPRPRVRLKAPTLAEMEEMNVWEEEGSPEGGEMRRAESFPLPLKRDRSFSEHDLAELRGDRLPPLAGSPRLGGEAAVRLRGERPRSQTMTGAFPPPVYRASYQASWTPSSPARLSLSSVDEVTETSEAPPTIDMKRQWMEEFSHPVESLALTVEEVINVRRVLVKAEMEKFYQTKELYNNLKKGKVCCCCKVKFPLFSWPSNCLLCKRSVCASCSAKMKIPSKKMAHIPVYTLGFYSSPKSHGHKSQVYKSLRSLTRRSVEEEFPHLYAHGCTLRDVCAECTKFVADVISSSRRSLDLLNTPKRESRPTARPPQAAPSPRPLSAPCPWGAPSQPPPSASRRQPLARADATLPNRAGK